MPDDCWHNIMYNYTCKKGSRVNNWYEWDEGNLSKLVVHRVTPQEAIEVLEGPTYELPYQEHHGEIRFVELGETKTGRILRLVWTTRGEKIRIINAFDASPWERRLYREGE